MNGSFNVNLLFFGCTGNHLFSLIRIVSYIIYHSPPMGIIVNYLNWTEIIFRMGNDIVKINVNFIGIVGKLDENYYHEMKIWKCIDIKFWEWNKKKKFSPFFSCDTDNRWPSLIMVNILPFTHRIQLRNIHFIDLHDQNISSFPMMITLSFFWILLPFIVIINTLQFHMRGKKINTLNEFVHEGIHVNLLIV